MQKYGFSLTRILPFSVLIRENTVKNRVVAYAMQCKGLRKDGFAGHKN